MHDISQYVFLKTSNFFILLLIATSVIAIVIAMGIIFLFDKFFQKKCSCYFAIMFYINVEEYTTILLASLWIFSIFSLPIAIIVWISAFFVLNYSLKNNQKIKLLSEENAYRLKKLLKKENLSIFNFHHVKSNIIKKSFMVVSDKQKLKRRIKGSFCFFKKYIWGLTIAPITFVLINAKNQYQNHVLLENIITLTAILFLIHKIAYILNVKNEVSIWFGDKLFFNLYYVFFSVVAYIIVIAITLS